MACPDQLINLWRTLSGEMIRRAEVQSVRVVAQQDEQVLVVQHEVGSFISPRAHHKHSEYIILNSEIFGLDRLDGLEGPAIFAANHHSHVDTPLLITSIPEPWRHRIVVAAAADYFFPTRVKGTAAAKPNKRG